MRTDQVLSKESKKFINYLPASATFRDCRRTGEVARKIAISWIDCKFGEEKRKLALSPDFVDRHTLVNMHRPGARMARTFLGNCATA